MLERLREVRETVAPRHMSKLTLEDDIGMIHELTKVSRHNESNHVGWAETFFYLIIGTFTVNHQGSYACPQTSLGAAQALPSD